MTTKRYSAQGLYKLPINYAQELGSNDRYVLSAFAHLQSKAKTKFDSRFWFYLPLRIAEGKASKSSRYRALEQYFPWLSPATIAKAVQRLVKGNYLRTGQYNARSGDRTLWYCVPEKVCKALKSALVRHFNPAEAAKPLSVNCALVLNVVYRDFHLKVRKQDQRLVFIHSALSRDLGIPVSTVGSVFVKLEQQGYLTTYISSEGKCYTLNVPNPCKMKGNGKGRKAVSKVIYVVTMEASNYQAVQHRLQVTHRAAAPVQGKLSLLQMMEEVYLVQLELEQIAAEKKQKKAAAKQKRVRRAIVPPPAKRVSRCVADADKADSQAARQIEAERNWRRSEGLALRS